MKPKQAEKPCLGCGLLDPPSGFGMRKMRTGARTWRIYRNSRCRKCSGIRDKHHEEMLQLGLVQEKPRLGLAKLSPEEWMEYQRNKGRKKYWQHVEKERARLVPWREAHKAEIAAHVAVHEAKLRGELIPKPCEVCGRERVFAHHDDYSKPLVVRWLCPSCHLAWHRSQENSKPPP